MPGRLRSTRNYRLEAGHFASDPKRIGKPVLRDGKTVFVYGPNESLVWKKSPLEMQAAMEFYRRLRKMSLKHVKIVPIKSDMGKRVQKYFHRPSMRALRNYLEHKLGITKGLDKKVTELDIQYCNDLLQSSPKVGPREFLWHLGEAERELRDTAGVGRPLDLIEDYFFNFDFSNFIVFGFTRKGILKAGLADI